MSRHASSRLLAFLTSTPSRPLTQRPLRTLTTSTRRFQQSPSSSSSSPSTPSTPPQPATTKQAAANAAQVSHELSPADESQPLRNLTDGIPELSTSPSAVLGDDTAQDWTRSFHGLSSTPFTPEQAAILQEEIPIDDIEVKPDGIIYLPEIKYRRILNRAFGPGGWGLAPRGATIVTAKVVTREYGLVCGGRLVSLARGEQQYFDPDGIPTATEGCKSNALMRCCKDLGVASELWDPRFIRRYLGEHARELLVEHAVTRKRRKHWLRKGDPLLYPFKEVPAPTGFSAAGSNNSGGGGKK